MAVDYLQEYLGIDPNDYSAMEQRIAGVSPVGQSILPQAPVLPRAAIMDESDFAAATAPLMDRVYGREQAAREKSESLSNELQALQEEMARTSEAEVEKRAALERQMQEIMQERDVSVTSAENLASELQGVQANLAEITNLRDIAVQDYQEALQQQDVIRQQASENEAMRLEEQRNQLLAEREGIITTLEQDFGIQRSELESVIGGLEGQVGDLTSKVGELESVKGSLEGQINDLSSQMQALEVEKQDALAQQDVIRAESAQAQQDALAQQGEQFATERSALEQQIADLTAQVGQQPPGGGQETGGGQGPIGDEGPPLNYMEFIESGRTPAEYNQYMKDYIARTMPDVFPDLSGLQNVTDETRQLVQDSLASGDPILAPDRIQDMIDNMSAATGEGGLPEGYSYTPGTGSEGMAYTTVMPRPGFRYAYGPDGDRIEVPDNRDSGLPLKPPTIEKLVPPTIEKLVPPKRDDQIFIDDRPTDPRLDRERGVPIGGNVPGGGGIDYGGPQQPPQKPISIGGVGGGTYKEFKGPDGQVLSVGVRPPSFSTNPDRKGLLGSLADKIQNSIQAVPVPPGQEGQLPMAPVNTGPITIMGQTLSQEDSDRIRAGSEGGLKGIVNRSSERLKNNPNTIRRGGFFNKIKAPQPPTMTPRRQPMSVGGVGGISGGRSMRPMMRAGGGAISQAIADLQNRLR